MNAQTGLLRLFPAGSQLQDLLSAVAEAQCGSGGPDGVLLGWGRLLEPHGDLSLLAGRLCASDVQD